VEGSMFPIAQELSKVPKHSWVERNGNSKE